MKRAVIAAVFFLFSALEARTEPVVSPPSSLTVPADAQTLAARLQSLADRAQAALDKGQDLALPDPDEKALAGEWPAMPGDLTHPFDPRWSQVQALYDALASLKSSGVKLSTLAPATRKLIAQGGVPGAFGRRLASPGEPPRALVAAVDGLARHPNLSDQSLRRLFDNDPTAARELPAALALTAGPSSPAADPNLPETQLAAGFSMKAPTPPSPTERAEAAPVPAISQAEFMRAAYSAIAAQPLMPQGLREKANLKISESMRAELESPSLPKDDPRRAELLAQYRRFNVSACESGVMPSGTTFPGRFLGDGFAPQETVTFVRMNGKPGFVLLDPKNASHQTFQSLDKRLIIEQVPQGGGREALVTTRLDAEGRKVVSREARIIDPRHYVIEGRMKADGSFAPQGAFLDDGTREHPALLDDKGELAGVALNDYKKVDLKALRRAGFLDTTYDALNEKTLTTQLARIAGMVSEPPRLVRLPPTPGFTDRQGDLALVYDAGGIHHLDRISPAGTHYAVTSATIGSDGRVQKIVACVEADCARQDEYALVDVSKYDDASKQWTRQGRVRITRDGVKQAGQDLGGDSALDAHLADAKRFLADNKWINWLPKSASFIGDRGLDLAYGFEEFENSMLTGKGDVERQIWGEVTHSQEPAMNYGKAPGQELMRALDSDLGHEVYGRFRKAMADAYRRNALKTAGDPQQALALSEGQTAPTDEEIGQFIRSGDAGLGFHGMATAAAQAAQNTDSVAAKIGYHAFGASASFAEIGSQGLAFEGLGYGLKALGSIGKAAEITRILPAAEETAAVAGAGAKTAQTLSLARVASTAFRANETLQNAYFKLQMPLDLTSSLVKAYENDDQVAMTRTLYQVGGLGLMTSLQSAQRSVAGKADLAAGGSDASASVLAIPGAGGASWASRWGFNAGSWTRTALDRFGAGAKTSAPAGEEQAAPAPKPDAVETPPTPAQTPIAETQPLSQEAAPRAPPEAGRSRLRDLWEKLRGRAPKDETAAAAKAPKEAAAPVPPEVAPALARLEKDGIGFSHDMPRAVDGVRYSFSDAFTDGQGRTFRVARLEIGGKTYHRAFYTSNTSGVYRLLPSFCEDWNEGKGWYDKGNGIGENGLTASPEVQKFLLSLKTPETMPTIEAKELKGIISVVPNRTAYYELVKSDGYVGKAVDTASPLKLVEAPADGGKMKFSSGYMPRPQDVVIADEGARPDFAKKPSTKYSFESSLYGHVDAEVYPSADGRLSYTMMMSDGKAWVGAVTPTGRGMTNEFGVARSVVKAGQLMMPLKEYSTQIPYEYGGLKIDVGRVSAWEYVREIPTIQDYYGAKNLAVPK